MGTPCRSQIRMIQRVRAAIERWTLVGVQTMIRRQLRVSLSVVAVWRLLKRHGWP
ncbi:winged helix-turn-helix domain-containing protein [Streptomyces bobili]|uniref:winged helix-turn-helix domain-containing protein n=1 Tax=Streptomyces bobili TaxID=67280 RepID=UPI0036EF3819